MSMLRLRLVVVHGSAGKGRNGQYGVSAAAATLIDNVGAVVECVRAFAGHVGVGVRIAREWAMGGVVSAGWLDCLKKVVVRGVGGKGHLCWWSEGHEVVEWEMQASEQ